MARQFLTAIDLAKNELQNAAIQNLAGAPSSPVKGQLYMNTTDNILYWWDGTAWQSAKAGSGFPGYGAVPAETTFGIAKNDGVATTVARSDHTHGSPAHSAAEHSAIPVSALAQATANVNMNNNYITNLAYPLNSGDAANKQYVDFAVQGFAWKDAVRAATTANITLSAPQTIDGVSVIAGDRVLVKNQSTASQNGIYLVAAGAWTRTTDADGAGDLDGAAVFVMEGTTQADTGWVCTTNPPITPGTTANAWAQFAGAGGGVAPNRQVIAGAGLTGGGDLSADRTFDVVGDASITVTADAISRAALTGDVTAAAGANATTIANDAVGNTKLTNMAAYTLKGNNSAGTTDPSDLTAAQVMTMLSNQAGAAKKYATNTVGGATSQTITHNLGSLYVAVQVFRNSTPWDTVECDVERVDSNSITLRFATAPAANAYSVVVVG